MWSVPGNWLDNNNTNRVPANSDDIYLGLAAGTSTTDDISLTAEFLDFKLGTNILTITGGNTLNINGGATVGINIDSGASAFIDATGAGSALQFTGSTTADGLSVEVDSGGKFDISGLTTTGVAIGELQGTNGTINLGAKNLTVGSSNTFISYNGTIGGTGGSLTKVGTGALSLNQANTYTGSTNIEQGTIGVSNDSALGTSAVTIGQTGSSNSARLNVASGGNVNIANNITVASLTGGATATISSIAGPASGPDQFTGNVTLNGDVNISTVAPASNPLTFSGQIAGSGGVTINPSFSGAVNFTGANGYNGNTNIQSGTFFANNSSGSATGNGNVIVNSGATLAGNGSMAGVVSVNSGATLAPGNNGIGILHVGSPALVTPSLLLSGTLSLEIGGVNAGSGYDQVITATGATIGGSLTLTLANGFTPTPLEMFYIIDNTSSDPALRTTGSFANAPTGFITDNAGDTYQIIYAGIKDPNNPSIFSNDVTLLALNVVPEPSTCALVVGGIGLLVVVRMRAARSIARNKA